MCERSTTCRCSRNWKQLIKRNDRRVETKKIKIMTKKAAVLKGERDDRMYVFEAINTTA